MHVMYLGAGAVSGEYVWIPSFWCISKIIIAYALLEMAPMVSKSFFFLRRPGAQRLTRSDIVGNMGEVTLIAWAISRSRRSRNGEEVKGGI